MSIHLIKSRLEEERLKAIKAYEIRIKHTRNAENTIVNEMNKHSSNAPSLLMCRKDLSETAKHHKLLRDMDTLKTHKNLLHKLAKQLKIYVLV